MPTIREYSTPADTDHRAQQVRVGALLHQPAQGHHLVGHRVSLGFEVGARNPTLPGNRR